MIVLFTDFGLEGPYTGQVKAVLYRAAPEVPVVELFADAPAGKPKPAAYLLAAPPDVQPWRVIEQLQSPKSRRGSPLKTLDKVLVVSIELGLATRMERVTDWLNGNGILG